MELNVLLSSLFVSSCAVLFLLVELALVEVDAGLIVVIQIESGIAGTGVSTLDVEGNIKYQRLNNNISCSSTSPYVNYN